jgi:O-antigen/teichoic acid export membrane protein
LPHAFGYLLRVDPARLRSASLALARHVLFVTPAAFAIAFALRYLPFASGGANEIALRQWPELGVLMLSELAMLLGLATCVPTARFGAYAAIALAPPVTLLASVAFWPKSDLVAARLLELLLGTSLFGSLVMTITLARAADLYGRAAFPVAAAYSYGLRSYGSALSKVAAQRFDRIFLVTVLGGAGYAQYSLAVSIRDMAIVPANLHAMTLRNRQIDLLARDRDLAGARGTLLKVCMGWLALGVVGAAVLYPFWPQLVQWVFGSRYEGSATFLRVVAFSCAPLAAMGFAWNHLYAMNRPGRVTVLTSASLALVIPVFAASIWALGPAPGVAAAVVIWSITAAGASVAWALTSRIAS